MNYISITYKQLKIMWFTIEDKNTIKHLSMNVLYNENKILTPEAAKLMEGKAINYVWHGDINGIKADFMIVGKVVSAKEYYSRPEECFSAPNAAAVFGGNFTNRWEYWQWRVKTGKCKAEFIEKQENTLMLLDNNGEFHGLYCHPSPTDCEGVFTCSSPDRPVFFEVVD